jgi:hypothetical protein
LPGLKQEASEKSEAFLLAASRCPEAALLSWELQHLVQTRLNSSLRGSRGRDAKMKA